MEWIGRLPAYFYGSLLGLLWSEMEAIFGRFAAEIESVKGVSLAFGDINGSSAYSRLRKYVQAVLGMHLPENTD